MINQLHLRNFKCFPNHKISFSPLTILAGGNGVGKSSVIQALLLMRRTLEVLEQGKKEVELNGPYLLQLGQASTVFSNQSQSNDIQLSLSSEDGISDVFQYNFDNERSPLSLELTNTCENEPRSMLNRASLRYLNAERVGPRKALEMNTTTELDVGYQGEYTNYALYQAGIVKRWVAEELVSQPRLKNFSAQVEGWMQTIIPNLQLKYEPFQDVNMVTVKYRNEKRGVDYYIPTATGFGITYVLPIIVAGLLASTENHSILIVENPEAHLHPLGQSRIGGFLALLSCTGTQVIVETHSEHVVNGARLQLANMKKPEQLTVNFFADLDNEIVTESLTLNEIGELSDWPPGFFDQEQRDLRELLRLKIQ